MDLFEKTEALFRQTHPHTRLLCVVQSLGKDWAVLESGQVYAKRHVASVWHEETAAFRQRVFLKLSKPRQGWGVYLPAQR